MHPIFRTQRPMMPTRGAVARYFYGSKIPPGAPDSPFRVAGAYAQGLNGFGAGAGGKVPVPNIPFGLNWTNGDAQDDFLSGVDLRGSAGRWSGVPQGDLNRFQVAGAAARGPKGSQVLAAFKNQAQPVVDRISNELQPFGFGGRSEQQDIAYKNAMQSVLNSMLAFTKLIEDANAADTADAGSSAASRQGQTGTKTSVLTTASGMPKWLPIGIAAALLGVAGYLLLRK